MNDLDSGEGKADTDGGRLDKFLPGGKFERWPKPLRFLVGLVIWPFIGVSLVVAGIGYLAVGLIAAVLAASPILLAAGAS